MKTALPALGPVSGTKHGPFSVNVADEWLRQPTLEAVTRINVAAGMEVFR